jgi:hypothetical protein
MTVFFFLVKMLENTMTTGNEHCGIKMYFINEIHLANVYFVVVAF